VPVSEIVRGHGHRSFRTVNRNLDPCGRDLNRPTVAPDGDRYTSKFVTPKCVASRAPQSGIHERPLVHEFVDGAPRFALHLFFSSRLTVSQASRSRMVLTLLPVPSAIKRGPPSKELS
jgi:hypothetical protein